MDAAAICRWNQPFSIPAPLGFIRITTHRRILTDPISAADACRHAESWLKQPQALLLHPGERHATILFDLLRNLGTAGNLTTDAHLAAIAIEHQAELNSTDADFARFSRLKWRNPIAEDTSERSARPSRVTSEEDEAQESGRA